VQSTLTTIALPTIENTEVLCGGETVTEPHSFLQTFCWCWWRNWITHCTGSCSHPASLASGPSSLKRADSSLVITQRVEACTHPRRVLVFVYPSAVLVLSFFFLFFFILQIQFGYWQR